MYTPPQAFDFTDLMKTIAIPFEFTNEKGELCQYELREATGGVAAVYQNAVAKCLKIDERGNAIPGDGLADTEVLLVAMCVCQIVPDQKGNRVAKPVTKELVKRWPSRMVKELYKQAQLISDLVQPDTEEAILKQIQDLEAKLEQMKADNKTKMGSNTPKNEPDSTLDGSE